MSFFVFVTNFLEPCCFLLYFLALQVFYRKNKMKAFKQLSFYYLTIGLLQLYASLEVKFLTVGNIWVYDTVAILTAVFISHHFYHLLQSRGKRKAVVALLAVYLVYAVIRHTTLEGRRLFDSIGFSILSATIAVYVFLYFHQVLQKVTDVSILKDLNFWLASGYLVYFVGSFIIFVTYYYFTTRIINTYTKEERALLTALWGLHNILLFISALSLLIGCLWINSRRKLESS
jgi:hypothetical protein